MEERIAFSGQHSATSRESLGFSGKLIADG